MKGEIELVAQNTVLRLQTDEVSSKHCFEVVDDSKHSFEVADKADVV
ncbi:hypothetical protein [Streptococcus pneumoniae]|nr:hypothetical protein [Streptococcus pneumoniae]